MGLSGIRVGRRVEFHSINNHTVIFRGDLLRVLGEDGFYALVRDATGLTPRIVRADRLHPVGWYGPSEGNAA